VSTVDEISGSSAPEQNCRLPVGEKKPDKLKLASQIKRLTDRFMCSQTPIIYVAH